MTTKSLQGTETNCRRCGALMVATPAQIAKRYIRCASCLTAKTRAYRATAEGRAIKKHHEREWYKKHPLKAKVRWTVQNAVRAGHLTRQPCEVCGSAKVHAHHDDYNKPLAVRWLCARHHADTHHGRI